MYSFSYLEPVYCPMSSSNFCFLACIQISQKVGQVVWYSHLFQNFMGVFFFLEFFIIIKQKFIVIHTVKSFSVVSEAEVDVFLEFPYFFYDPMNVGNLISGSCAFSKFSLCI